MKTAQKLAKQGKEYSGLAKEVFELWKKRFKKTDEPQSNGKDSYTTKSNSSAQSKKSTNETSSRQDSQSISNKSTIMSNMMSLYSKVKDDIKLKDSAPLTSKRNNFRSLFYEALCWKEGKVIKEEEHTLEEDFILNVKDLAISIEESNNKFHCRCL